MNFVIGLMFNELCDWAEADEAKDIGVTMHENLKPSVHCN